MQQFEVINTEIPPEEIGKKQCRLDINMVVDGKRVNIEIQVEDEGNYPERSLFHWAREYSSALPSGDDYLLLPRTIIISIISFWLFGCEEVHSEFQALEVRQHTALTDKLGLHYFELPKLKGIDSIESGNEQELWLALFKAETEEELTKLKKTGGVIMSQAIEAYREITAKDEFKYLERLREDARHDEAQALGNAKRQGAKIEREKWQGVVAEKDAALANKDAEIERLRLELAEAKARLDENK